MSPSRFWRHGPLLALLAAVLLTACTRLPTYRYEITVEIDTPVGLKSGSSIIEVRTRLEPKLLPDMSGYTIRVIGEAVAVDLPGGQTLFAVLQGDNSAGSAGMIAPATLLGLESLPLTEDEIMRLLPNSGRAAIVPRRSYPLLVRFRDIRAPHTLESVDPDDLESAFGSGTRLRTILIRSTESAPTFGLQRRLRWLETEENEARVLMRAKASTGITYVLGGDDFQRR